MKIIGNILKGARAFVAVIQESEVAVAQESEVAVAQESKVAVAQESKVAVAQESKEKTFAVTFWCKNCHKESDYTFPVGTDISHSSLAGDSTNRVHISGRWTEVRCKICEIGSLF